MQIDCCSESSQDTAAANMPGPRGIPRGRQLLVQQLLTFSKEEKKKNQANHYFFYILDFFPLQNLPDSMDFGKCPKFLRSLLSVKVLLVSKSLKSKRGNEVFIHVQDNWTEPLPRVWCSCAELQSLMDLPVPWSSLPRRPLGTAVCPPLQAAFPRLPREEVNPSAEA